MMLIVAWPIAGSLCSGSYGIVGNFTTRLIICSSDASVANQLRSRTLLTLLESGENEAKWITKG
jgi:hypothetical protein